MLGLVYCCDTIRSVIMSKRKFADFKEQRASKPTAHNEVSIKHSRVYGVLDNGKTNLFRALKVARGFERQKLGRRQKNAKKDGADGDMARLEAETVALKVCALYILMFATDLTALGLRSY